VTRVAGVTLPLCLHIRKSVQTEALPQATSQLKGNTMRLTKTIREAFVRAALHDVPRIDYVEQARKALVEEFVAIMPPEVATAYKKHPEWIAKSDYYYINAMSQSFAVPRPNNLSLPADAQSRIFALAESHKAQQKMLRDLEAKLSAVAEGASSRKQLAEALPEFEKYLPAEGEKATRSLPAIANVVAEFTKAGWPKQQAKVQA
jgi:hypothetical protein